MFSIAIHILIHDHFSIFLGVMTSRPHTVARGPLSAKFSHITQTSIYVKCC